MDFDSYDFAQLDSFFDASIDLAGENVLLAMELRDVMEQLEKTKSELRESKLEIRSLKRRVGACESAILWCGETCFDEMEKEGTFKKIKVEDKEIIDLTRD